MSAEKTEICRTNQGSGDKSKAVVTKTQYIPLLKRPQLLQYTLFTSPQESKKSVSRNTELVAGQFVINTFIEKRSLWKGP